MKYQIILGHINGPKWIPEITLWRDNYNDALTMMQAISAEFAMHPTTYKNYEPGISHRDAAKMLDDKDKLHYYITSSVPRLHSYQPN